MSTNHQQCRFCDSPLQDSFVDLGISPLSNSYLRRVELNKMEPFYPLHAYVCASCFLVQLVEFQSPEQIFSDYAYFSSFSETWLKHAKIYVEQMTNRFQFNSMSQVVEIASNDGYLLQYFKEQGFPVLGIEPAKNVAKIAEQIGIPTITEFFGSETALQLCRDGKQADLLIGNNVLAHVPNLNDFVKGLKILLKPNGIISMEFPHLLNLIKENQFDTIYHEHFSYLSLLTVKKMFAARELTIFDVQELPTHGGSLRIYARHADDESKPISDNVAKLLSKEKREGLCNMDTYTSFSSRVQATKRKLLEFLIKVKDADKSIVGYGAPAKGNTILNYCGIREDFIDYTVDRSPHKQGLFLPGTHIPILHPEKILETKPDYVLILPWNIKEEIIDQMSCIRQWGGQFIVPIPEVKVYS